MAGPMVACNRYTKQNNRGAKHTAGPMVVSQRGLSPNGLSQRGCGRSEVDDGDDDDGGDGDGDGEGDDDDGNGDGKGFLRRISARLL